MGVNLKQLFEHVEIKMDQLNGQRLAIDAFNIIYQFLTSIRQRDGTPLLDSEGEVTSHLSGLFYRNINFLEAGLRPVYVFDGKPPKFKQDTIRIRTERKKQAEKKYEKAVKQGAIDEMKMYAQQMVKLTDEMVDESKELLSALGIPVVQAITEGEAQSALMAANGLVDASVSQDYDSLLFGSPILIRNLSITGRRKLPRRNDYTMIYPEKINLKQNLERLGINRKKLIWIGVLIGTDYNQGIKGIGPKKALKLVKECDDFNDIKKLVEEKYTQAMPCNIEDIIRYFENPPYLKLDESKLAIKKPDEKEVIEILCETHDFSQERVENGLRRLSSALNNKIQQTDLSQFFD